METVIPSPAKKESVIWLPEYVAAKFCEQLEQTRSLDVDQLVEKDVISVINEVLNRSSKKHLDVLKKITRNLTSYSSSQLWPLVVEILISGLYHCHSNHIIKSSINGVMRHLSDKDLGLVSTHVHNSLDRSVKDELLEMNGVELVAAFLQSDFGCEVIVSNINFIIDFFLSLLSHQSKEVQLSKPTTEIAKLHSNIHSVSRTLLSILKFIKVETISLKSQQLSNSIIAILNNTEIPLEVQGNCSKILIVLTQLQKNGMQCIVEKILAIDNQLYENLIHLEDSIPIRLNLSIALLSTLEVHQLLEDHLPFGTLLGGVIPSILLNSSERLNETGLAILTARLVEQWQRKCFECFTSWLPISQLLLTEWHASSDRLLEITLNGLEHHIDVVRHTSKEAFLLNLKIHLLLKNDVDRIVQTILDMPMFKKSKYMALACLAKTELAPILLRSERNVAEELLDAAKDTNLASQAREVLNLLMFRNVEQTDEWMGRWLHPLLSAMENHPNGQSFETSLVDLLKLHPEIIRNVEIWCKMDYPSRLSVYITALLVSRKLGLFPTNLDATDECLWNGVIKLDVLEQSLEHRDDKLRLNALGVIIEGPKSTQLYSYREIDWVRQFIIRNMTNPNAAFRQQLCSYLKKFLLKLRNGGVPLIGRNEEIVGSYRNFVFWLTDKCLIDLGPGSSFPRRFLSLQILKLIQDIIGLECNLNGLNVIPCLGLAAISSLADCFFDSYDVNKDLALELLQSQTLLTVVNQDSKGAELIRFYWESSLALSQSLRSADTVAAGFFLRWLIHLSIPRPEEQEPSIQRKMWSQVSNCTFDVVNQLMRMLKGQLDAARGNLCRLAIDAPIYGLLSSVRLLLNDQQSRADKIQCGEWAFVVSNLVNFCFEASAIASPVVTSDSPEGFLPESSASSPVSLNAQALLVSAWHTVKEVALLFGQLTVLGLSSDCQLLNNEVILKIGLHLKQLLLETKHRGAFEQVYCGFSQLSYALWRSPIRELNILPTTWLSDIVHDLQVNESAAKLCATRRSAGLPFVFQAILSPEVEMGRGELFSRAIESLLNIAADGPNECRIHALNILRNLYRESRLNQVIGPYVSRGLVLSINGFEAPDWAERNSSTLLFSALMTRIFGVPRSKNDFQKKNCLTGRMFFQLYPQLYPFLLERLGSCTSDISNNGIHLHPALFPMLVLLGRLHPPACEFSDSAYKLEPFVPLVRLCGSSPVLKTRQLAAQALTPLLTPRAYVNFLPELFDSIPISTSRNQLHGTLLQIHNFVKDILPCTEPHSMVLETLKRKIPQLIFLLGNSCFLIRYEYSEILLLLHSAELLDPSIQADVFRMCMDGLQCRNLMLHGEPFYPLSCQKLAALATPSNTSETANVLELLKHPLQEVRLEVIQKLNQMDSTSDWALLWPTLATIITDEKETLECRIQALNLFAYLGAPGQKLKWALEVYREATEDSVQCSALAAAGRPTHSVNSDNFHLLVEWSRYLLEAMQCPIQFRQIVVESIAVSPKVLQMDASSKDTRERGSLLSNLWMCLLNCLIDNEESIRSAAAAIVGNIYDGCWKQAQPALAIEKGLEYLIGRVGSFFPTEVISLLSKLVLDEDEELETGDSPSFEKGDSDAFREPLAHSILFCQFIERCAKQDNVSLLDSDFLADYLENRWKILENCDSSFNESLAYGRRFGSVQIIGIIKLFLLTKSLLTTHAKICILHQRIRKRLEHLNLPWQTYSLRHLAFPVST